MAFPFTTMTAFLAHIGLVNPIDLAIESLYRNFVHAFPEESMYKSFLSEVKVDYPLSERIAIMGSGNWKFSLNPDKNFSEYNINSDIDIAIICRVSFEQTWEELRKYHRDNFYLLQHRGKTKLKRNGENVYSGFVSPKWIPGKSKVKFKYALNINKYSNVSIGYRKVNMMYFKSLDETVDYYMRGFIIVNKRVNKS